MTCDEVHSLPHITAHEVSFRICHPSYVRVITHKFIRLGFRDSQLVSGAPNIVGKQWEFTISCVVHSITLTGFESPHRPLTLLLKLPEGLPVLHQMHCSIGHCTISRPHVYFLYFLNTCSIS